MSEYYRNKEYRKKPDFTGNKDVKRGGMSGHRDRESFNKKQPPEKKVQQPTILIKARDHERAPSPKKSTATSATKKDGEKSSSYQIQAKSSSIEATVPQAMTTAVPLLHSDFISLQDSCLEFLSDDTDFLVVGCLGCQSVGKSTLMSLLANKTNGVSRSEDIFASGPYEDSSSVKFKTKGIDFYVTNNRILLLDCQPILAATLQSNGDNNPEMTSLQLAAFLFTVCHVVLFIQDFFMDPDLIRFLQTAEMLKPSTSPSYDEAMVEHFPHLIFVQNKAEGWEFRSDRIKCIQETYLKAFSHSRLQIQTGFGIANGDICPTLTTATCGELMNLFLLPNIGADLMGYTGHPSFKDIFRQMRNQIISTPRTPLTHTLLTEKQWFQYSSKVWESILKSSFFNEYHRLINAIW